MKFYNQTEYAKHAGLSQQRISQLIKGGFLKGALKKFGKRQLINPVKADELLNENISQVKRKQPPARPTDAEVQAATWDADQPPLEHAILENLRYLVKLAELDPAAIQVVYPGPGQEGVVIQYNIIDDDVIVPEILNICTVFDDPADHESWSADFNIPNWFNEMDAETRERLK